MEIADIAQKAETAKARLRELAATLTSPDGAATVTVNASGALQRLSFGAKARDLPLEQLANVVLNTARRAQVQAAQQMTDIMAPIIGTDSDAMKFLEEQFPKPEVEEPKAAPKRPQSTPDDESAPIMRKGW